MDPDDEIFEPDTSARAMLDDPVGEVDTINDIDDNDRDEQRRIAALQMATHVQYPSIDDFLAAADKVDKWLKGE